tara:strand:+ start:95 stop:433 length:339 start_codon:yes stop_codon:yes gene_type:complete
MIIELTRKEKIFVSAYFDALDFTEDSKERELCEVFKREQVIECLAFFVYAECYLSDDNIEQAGHDFWLSRNGHGTGFWDRDSDYYTPYVRDWLQRKAETFKDVEVIYEDFAA